MTGILVERFTKVVDLLHLHALDAKVVDKKREQARVTLELKPGGYGAAAAAISIDGRRRSRVTTRTACHIRVLGVKLGPFRRYSQSLVGLLGNNCTSSLLVYLNLIYSFFALRREFHYFSQSSDSIRIYECR